MLWLIANVTHEEAELEELVQSHSGNLEVGDYEPSFLASNLYQPFSLIFSSN